MNESFAFTGIFPQKAISAPFISGKIPLYGELTSAVWQQAARISDFTDDICERDNAEIRIFRCEDAIYIGGKCNVSNMTITQNSNCGKWQGLNGDHVELLFGPLSPYDELMMIAISSAGNLFYSGVASKDIEYKVHCENNAWSFEACLPMSVFHSWSYGMRFNCFWQLTADNAFLQWRKIAFSTFEPEHAGELLFCSYQDALFYKTGFRPDCNYNRNDYEAAINAQAPDQAALLSTPWLTAPSESSVDACFFTSGAVQALLQFRETGDGSWRNTYPTQIASFPATSFHRLSMTGLIPGKQYEYRIVTKKHVDDTAALSQSWTFRHLPTNGETHCAFFSDAHGDAENLQRLLALQSVKTADFIGDLGDLSLQYGMSKRALFHYGLKTYADASGGGKPLVILRGNHDQHGMFASELLQASSGPDGRSFYAFRCGSTLFLALDSGVDVKRHPYEIEENCRLRDDERQWILELQKSSLWLNARFRVALIHMTAYDGKYGSQEFIRMTSGLFDDTPDKRLHAFIGGHLHFYYHQMPHSDAFGVDGPWSQDSTSSVQLTQPPAAFPWFTICIPAACGIAYQNAMAAYLKLDTQGDELHLELRNVHDCVLHSFRIYSSGQTEQLQ